MDDLTFRLWLLDHPEWLYAIALFAFGASVGSFLNVVIFRLPYGLNLFSPLSTCPKCGHGIKAWENIPILSYLALRGKCSKCRAPIHWRYPFVELLNGVLWGCVGYVDAESLLPHYVSISILMIHLIFVASLVVATFIDFDHQIIPDEITLGGGFILLVLAGFFPDLHVPGDGTAWYPATPVVESLLRAFAGMAAGAGLLYVITRVGTFFMQERIKKVQETEDEEVDSVMGWGDTKLMGMAGALIGWKAILVAFFIGNICGAFVGLFDKFRTGESLPPNTHSVETDGWIEKGMLACMIFLPPRTRASIVHRFQTGISVLPLGPYLCIGILTMFFLGEPILAWVERLFNPVFSQPAIAMLP